MRRFAMIIAMAALPGCAVTLAGNQTTGGGTTATTTGSSVQGGTRVGNARIGGSFGTPPPASAPGGQVRFSNEASAVLVLGLAIAGVVDIVGGWLQPAAERREPLSPDGISHTCSCYGWQPELTPPPQPQ